MKKITKPAEAEECVYYSDFSGKLLNDFYPPVELKIDFNYGSKNDGSNLTLHLDDNDIECVLELIKNKISEQCKKNLAKELKTCDDSFNDNMQFRDWDSCDKISNKLWFLKNMLDIKDE